MWDQTLMSVLCALAGFLLVALAVRGLLGLAHPARAELLEVVHCAMHHLHHREGEQRGRHGVHDNLESNVQVSVEHGESCCCTSRKGPPNSGRELEISSL